MLPHLEFKGLNKLVTLTHYCLAVQRMLQDMLGAGEVVRSKNQRQLSCNLGSILRINNRCGVV